MCKSDPKFGYDMTFDMTSFVCAVYKPVIKWYFVPKVHVHSEADLGMFSMLVRTGGPTMSMSK